MVSQPLKNSGHFVLTPLPLKQGLKHRNRAVSMPYGGSLNASSIKTRIETAYEHSEISKGMGVLTPLPLKQGLKLCGGTGKVGIQTRLNASSIKTRIETRLRSSHGRGL